MGIYVFVEEDGKVFEFIDAENALNCVQKAKSENKKAWIIVGKIIHNPYNSCGIDHAIANMA